MRYEGGTLPTLIVMMMMMMMMNSTKNVLQIGSCFSHIYLRPLLRNAAFNRVHNLFVAEFRVEEVFCSKVLKYKM